LCYRLAAVAGHQLSGLARPVLWAFGVAVIGGRWGARRGASGRRYRAIISDVERLKLLVEPLLATSSHALELHGMQGDPRLARLCSYGPVLGPCLDERVELGARA